jgi:F0F1-type ATP synthase delta subunit
MDIFIKLTYTKKDALRRIRLLKDLLGIYFFDKERQSKFVKSVVALEKKYEDNDYYRLSQSDLIFIEKIGEKFLNQFTPAVVEIQLQKLQDMIEGAKQIVLYIPFEPDQHSIEVMGEYIKKNFGEMTLFTLSYDPGLVGGCSISFNGVLKDYSLKEKILNSKTEVEKVMQGMRKGI